MPLNHSLYLRLAALGTATIGAVSFTWLASNGLGWLPWCLFVSLITLDLLRDTEAGLVRWKEVFSRLHHLFMPAYVIPVLFGCGILIGGQLSSEQPTQRIGTNSVLPVYPNQIGKPPTGVTRPVGPIFTGSPNLTRPNQPQAQPRLSMPPKKVIPAAPSSTDPTGGTKTTN